LKRDREFLAVLRQAETDMNGVFEPLAHQVGDVVLRSAGEDGKVPVERLRDVQAAAHRLVDAAILGPQNKAFDDGNKPLSGYARAISDGQLGMIDLALERQAKLLDRLLPADVRDGLRERFLRGNR
jgi:hypothetical protein